MQETSLEKIINELSENHLFPMTLMLEYRAGHLNEAFSESLFKLLLDNLAAQDQLVTEEPYRSLILDQHDNRITKQDLELWKQGILNPPKRRIAVDQYVKASFARLSIGDNVQKTPDLTKIKDLNQFVFLHRFEAYAHYYPDHPALLFKNQLLTYAQLNARANQLAHYLLDQKKARGIQPDQEFIIGTFLPREPEWIIAILAIWKAGGAFIAIDPTAIGNSPDAIDDYFEKFAQTISDGKPAFILTHSDHQYLLPKPDKHGFSCICIDDCAEAIAKYSTDNTTINQNPDDLAYILYTSGSSGRPKGVEIAHRGFMPCLEAHRECVDLTHESIMAQYATCDFDAWVAEMLILGVGGTLAIVPSEIRLDEKRCARYYQDHKISVVIFTPAFLNKLGGPENFPCWKALFIVGESFDWELVKKWKTDTLQIVNGYGLTETTICATLENLDMEDVGKPISIGKPILGTKILIKTPKNIETIDPTIEKDYGPETTYMDPDSPLSAIDREGELWVGGISLTRGYRGEAMQNNEWRFVEIEDQDYYKSGDKAILRPDGRLEHQGRYSRMVKISGKRIELPSIEANLCKHFQLKKMGVAVTAVGNSLEDKNLTSILVFLAEKEQIKIDEETLKNFIRSTEKNIDKQTPLHIIWKKSFPTTQTKINLAELNKSYFEALAKKASNESMPDAHMDEEEAVILSKLKNCWGQILTQDNPKIEADFFELGGLSIDISLLIQVLRREFPQLKEEINNNFVLECRTLLSQTKRVYSLQHPVELVPLKKNQQSDAPYIIFCPPSILGDPEQDYTDFFSCSDEIFGKPIFDERFQVYGLKARGLSDPSLMPTSLYSMAQDYALTIKNWVEKNSKVNCPIFILGWSSGGTVTPEIVRVLAKYSIQSIAYVCDSIAPFSYHHFTTQEHTQELIFLVNNLRQFMNIKLDRDLLAKALNEIQKPRDQISYCFEYLIKKSKEKNKNILLTAKIIRLAEHNYIIREKLPAFTLFKAKKYLLKDLVPEDKTHYWPRASIRNLGMPAEKIIDGDHFEMIRSTGLAKIIASKMIYDYATQKISELDGMLEKQGDYVVPSITIVDPTFTDEESKKRLPIAFSGAVKSFLLDFQKKVLLIHGESGIGKSISMRRLDIVLSNLRVNTKTLFLNGYTCENLKRGIEDELNDWKKESPQLRVLILEGYDERQGGVDYNYYETNKLSNFENLKVIFTCRTETLKPGYRTNFIIPAEKDAFDEFKIQTFTTDQIKALIRIKHQTEQVTQGKIEEIYQVISQHEGLIDLVSNPLLLIYVLASLPKLLKLNETITRYKIYQAFCQDYFERGEQKLKSQSGIDEDVDFQLECREYTQKVAIAFFSEGITSYQVPKRTNFASIKGSKKTVKSLADLFKPESKNLLKACPFNIQNKNYRFIHNSLLEYFVVDAMVCILNEVEIEFHEIQNWFIENELKPQRLASNESIGRFWAESYRDQSNIKNKLFKIIHSTKDEPKLNILGGICLTLLNLAHEVILSTSFSNAHIKNAILDNALFDNVNFESATLEDISCKESWFHNCSFLNVKFSNINFHESSPLNQRFSDNILLHPNGNLAITSEGYTIKLWDIHLAKCVFTLIIEKYIDFQEKNQPYKKITNIKLSHDQNNVIFWINKNNNYDIFHININNLKLISSISGIKSEKIDFISSKQKDKTLMIYKNKKKITVQDFFEKNLIAEIEAESIIENFFINETHAQLVTTHKNSILNIWSIKNGQLLTTIEDDLKRCSEYNPIVYFNKDCSILAIIENQYLSLWNIYKSCKIETIELPTRSYNNILRFLYFIGDNFESCIYLDEDMIKKYNLITKEIIHLFNLDHYISSALSLDQSLLFVQTNRMIRILEIEKKFIYRSLATDMEGPLFNEQLIRRPSRHANNHISRDLKFSVRLTNKDLVVYDFINSIRILTYSHKTTITTFDLSENNSLLASASQDYHVLIWNLLTKNKIYSFEKSDQNSNIKLIKFNSDGSLLAIASNKNLAVLNTKTLSRIAYFEYDVCDFVSEIIYTMQTKKIIVSFSENIRDHILIFDIASNLTIFLEDSNIYQDIFHNKDESFIFGMQVKPRKFLIQSLKFNEKLIFEDILYFSYNQKSDILALASNENTFILEISSSSHLYLKAQLNLKIKDFGGGIAFSENGNFLALDCIDGIHIVDCKTFAKCHTLKVPTSKTCSYILFPDSENIIIIYEGRRHIYFKKNQQNWKLVHTSFNRSTNLCFYGSGIDLATGIDPANHNLLSFLKEDEDKKIDQSNEHGAIGKSLQMFADGKNSVRRFRRIGLEFFTNLLPSKSEIGIVDYVFDVSANLSESEIDESTPLSSPDMSDKNENNLKMI